MPRIARNTSWVDALIAPCHRGAHKAFPTGEGGSRVSRKRETDEGKGSPSYGRGASECRKSPQNTLPLRTRGLVVRDAL